VADASRDEGAVQQLYNRFVEERIRAGEAHAPHFENFRNLIRQQTERIRAEKGAQAVDFRLETRDGKVSLKARIVK
jgi:malonyl CoA-acyl carrier protein transacylase